MLNELLISVNSHPRCIASGVAAKDVAGDIVISRNGKVLGVWRKADNALDWTPAGHKELTHRVFIVDNALRHTLSALWR